MNKLLKLLPVLVCGYSLQADVVTNYWIGPVSGGSFQTAANWSEGEPPDVTATTSHFVAFTNEANVSVSLSGYVSLAGMSFSGGGVYQFAIGSYRFRFCGDESTLDVAPDTTVKFSGNVVGTTKTVLTMTGGGTVSAGSAFGNADTIFKKIIVQDGVLMLDGQWNDLMSTDPVEICNGAKLQCTQYDGRIGEDCVIQVDEGGILDLGEKANKFRAVTGSGSVVNVLRLTLTLENGPYSFAGSMSGNLLLFEPSADESRIYVVADDSLSDCSLGVTGENYTGLDRIRMASGADVISAAGLTFSRFNTSTAVDAVDLSGQCFSFCSGNTAGGAFGFYKAPTAGFKGTFIADGTEFRSTFAGSVNWGNASAMNLFVGDDGVSFDIVRADSSADVALEMPILPTEGSKGGLVKRGNGILRINSACNVVGPVVVTSGRLRSAYNIDTPTVEGRYALGAGSLRLNGASLAFMRAKKTQVAPTAGSTFTFAHGSHLLMENAGTEVTIGAASSEVCPLVREGHGILAIQANTSSGAYVGEASKVLSTGPVESAPCGITALPVFLRERYALGDGNYGMGYYLSDRCYQFAAYDAQKGFVRKFGNVTNAIPPTATEADLAVAYSAAPVLVSENAHVGAIEVNPGFYQAGASDLSGGYRIEAGVTLTVGPNSGGIAPVLLNGRMSKSARLIGAGTLSFGACEGLFLVGDTWPSNGSTISTDYNDAPSVVGCCIAGTHGVTFAAPASLNKATWARVPMRGVKVTGQNSYTGGTWLENVLVYVTSPSSLGLGPVSVSGDEVQGAQLHFDAAYEGGAFANALTVSGVGHVRETANFTLAAAISAAVDVSLTGGVTLAGDAVVAAVAPAKLRFDAPISGTGNLTISGDGTVLFSRENTFAGRVSAQVGSTLELAGGSARLNLAAFEGALANTSRKAGWIVLDGGTTKASDLPTFTGKIGLDIPENGILDLEGGSLTVYAKKGAGTVVNGTLIETGDPGLVIFVR